MTTTEYVYGAVPIPSSDGQRRHPDYFRGRLLRNPETETHAVYIPRYRRVACGWSKRFVWRTSLRAAAPAIAAGNAVVLKPATNTPITGGLLFAKLFEESGLPDGVLNVVTGRGSDIGDRVAGH